jgi:diphthamide synthase (EF-2-diphthine--ammonia ligase)
MRSRALIAWSGGKDCAFALAEWRRTSGIDVAGALVTINDTSGRVSMHDIREEIVRAQLAAAALSGHFVRLPSPCPAEVYDAAMSGALAEARAAGITHMIFGDLFLDSVRAYREERLAATGITPLFPLWGRPTGTLAREMIAAGLKTHLATVDLARLPARCAGRAFDEVLLAELPDDVDPCGENGEFHTCVSDGPMFFHPLKIAAGGITARDGYAYCDLRLSG